MAKSKKETSLMKRISLRSASIILKVLFFFFIFTTSQILLLKYLNPPFTSTMAVNWVQHKLTGHSYIKPLYLWRDLNEISPYLRRSVLAGEDQRFLSHHGFDFIELKKAVKDIVMTKRIRGASTITMQMARTVFLWQDRGLLRKCAEAYYTILIETFWTKERIFEIYLNTVDWGDGIIGAEAASKRYFHRTSARIRAFQAAQLASILPNPHQWSLKKPNRYVKIRQRKILKDMKKMPLLRSVQ